MAAEEATAHAASAGGHGLAKKIGPLPIWAWAAVVLGSYLLFHYLKNRNSSTGAAVTGSVPGGNNAAPMGLQVTPGGQIVDPTTGDVIGTVGSGGNSPNGGQSTTTVQGWLAAAQGALQGLGLDNNTINGALNDYVAGNQLPQTEYNIVNEAIKIIGSPPTSLGNPALAPPAPTPTGGSGGTPSAPAPSLPPVNAASWPTIIKYGQYASDEFTQIGEVVNGQYQGAQVSGGVPVYATAFGGFFQGWSPSNYSGPIYIPTQYLAYEQPSGHNSRPLATAA